MIRRKLGRTGPEVSAIGLGCMSFAGAFGETTEAESHRCLDAAWDHGINFLDTSNVYGMGRSESVIGSWLKRTGKRPVIATKAGIVRDGTSRRWNNSAEHLRSELDGSLKRLGIDHIELFYVHRRDPAVEPEDLAQSLAALEKEGKIGGYGLSEVAPGTLRRAHAVHPCRAVQSEYSLWTRLPELGMIQATAELGVAFVPFSPLARGALGTLPPDPDKLADNDFRRGIPRFGGKNWALNRLQLARFADFARERATTPAALAMAWVLARGDHLIPIPGTRTAEHLADWAGAADMRLTARDLAEIEAIMPVGSAHGDRYSDEAVVGTERYS
jgi:aryl-alcohol dehydrogenase-like predicted oxidoreductase